MKKTSLFLSLLAVTGFMAVSCGNEKNDNNASQDNIAKIIAKADSMMPNYRYVDLDTVLAKYKLAKDYNEEILRMQNNMENEVRRHENNIQAKATAMQNKLNNNGYLTEASLKEDQQQIANLQTNAQKAVAALQSNFESTAMMAQKSVTDSIAAFIQEYNAKKHYDAIFMKAATLYINPALDITDEIVEGLNARYNKAK